MSVLLALKSYLRGAWQAPKVRAKIRGSLGFVLGNFHFKMLQRIEDI